MSTKNTISQQQLNAAIEAYNLQDLVKILPPANYKAHAKKTVRSTIEAVCQDFILTPYLKAIPTKMGARTDKGKLSKRIIVETLYDLNRYRTNNIEKLKQKWVRKAIKYAVKNGRKIDVAFVLRLEHENGECYQKILEAKKAEEKQKEKDAKKAAIAAKMATAVKANESLPYAGAIIDLTQNNLPKDLNSITLPLADDALVFIAVYPKDEQRAYSFIDTLGLIYVDSVVWDRDVQVPTGDWTKNQHTNVLVAIKGTPKEPDNDFQLASVYFEHKTPELLSLPDYYFSMMEEMNPGEQYLEVFSCCQFSDKWHIFETNS